MLMHVSELWIYPIKSCRGIAVEQFTLDDRGPANDRRWMLVDAGGRFLSQRVVPRLALIDVWVAEESVVVAAPGMPELTFGATTAIGAQQCTVWRDTIDLQHVSADADRWFTEFLRVDCRLMGMPQTTQRPVDPAYAKEARLVSLADGFPMLLIGTASLDLLNGRLVDSGQARIPMRRFRPNVVVTTGRAHEEDEWRSIRIGDVDCSVVKPCARCVTTTIDIETGRPGVEPLRTLASYRRRGSKVFFGQNVIHNSAGTLHRGDRILVGAS